MREFTSPSGLLPISHNCVFGIRMCYFDFFWFLFLFCSASGNGNGFVRKEALSFTGTMVRDASFHSDDEGLPHIQPQVISHSNAGPQRVDTAVPGRLGSGRVRGQQRITGS